MCPGSNMFFFSEIVGQLPKTQGLMAAICYKSPLVLDKVVSFYNGNFFSLDYVGPFQHLTELSSSYFL